MRMEMTVLSEPADTEVDILHELVERSISVSGPARDFKVLFARYTTMSEGSESMPHAGTMMERFVVAR